MTFAGILSLLKLLPTMIELARHIEDLITQGIDLIQIKEAMKSIDKAFVEKNAVERARRLNDVFRKP